MKIQLQLEHDVFQALDAYMSLDVINVNTKWTYVEIEVSKPAHIMQILAAGRELGAKSMDRIHDCTPQDVIDAISAAFSIEADALTGKRRDRHIAEARHAWRYILNKIMRNSTTVTGVLTDCDHTSVLHSSKAAQDLIDTDDQYAARVRSALAYLRLKNQKDEYKLHNSEQPVNIP